MKRVKRGLAVLMTMLLMMPTLPAYAREIFLVEGMEVGDTVSDGDRKSEEKVGVYGNIGEAMGTKEEQVVAYANGDIASGISNSIVWVIDKNGKLTVEGTGDVEHVGWSDSAPWCDYFSSITSAEINVTGMTDASSLFYMCRKLTSIDLSGLDTSTITNMSNMFYYCDNLTNLDVSEFDTSKVIDMSNMFQGCYSLLSLDVSSFNTSSVMDMSGMFGGCGSLSSLDISNFDTSKVTDMGYMFYDCYNLLNLDVSGFDTSNVTNMSGMFCMFGVDGKLEELDVSNFNTSKVTDMSAMFKNCNKVTKLDVSNFDTTNVQYMGNRTYIIMGLEDANEEADWVNERNEMRSNYRCMSEIELHDIDLDDVELDRTELDRIDFEGMFSGCSSLKELDLSNFDTSNVISMDGMFSDCSSLIELDLGNFDTSNVIFMDGMFCNCSSLKMVDVNSFNTDAVKNMIWMFYGCKALESLDISNFNTANVNDMSCMFQNCSSLSKLNLSNFNTSNVEHVYWMFNGCSNLTELDLSNFDLRRAENADTSYFYSNEMFINCTNLKTIYTPYNLMYFVSLPMSGWHLPDGTEITELPQNLSSSVLITRSPVITTTTEALNMPDVVRVKYVPYSYTVQTDNTDSDNQITFSVAEGRLAEGLQMYPATGEIYGVPLEAGEFNVTVQASYSNPKYPASYAELKLIVLENTDDNVGTATDSGYEITQPVPDLNTENLSGSGTQLLISEGEYTEFQDAVYLDGRRLQSGTEYTSEAGSTRITIQNQTLADAGAGSHTLSLEFRTQDTGVLRRAAQNLMISGAGSSGDPGNNGTPDDGGNDSGIPDDSGNDSGTPDDGGNDSGTPDDGGNSNGMPGDGGNNSGTPDNNADSSGNTDDNMDDDGQDAAPASNAVTVIDYIVQSGDNLWKIAARFYGNGRYWRQIYMDNADVIRYPDRLRTGWHLKIHLTGGNGTIGAAAAAFNTAGTITGSSYTVQPGDNLWRIAGKVYGKSERWREIYEVNRTVLTDPEHIYAKQVLAIP